MLEQAGVLFWDMARKRREDGKGFTYTGEPQITKFGGARITAAKNNKQAGVALHQKANALSENARLKSAIGRALRREAHLAASVAHMATSQASPEAAPDEAKHPRDENGKFG